MLQHTSDYQTRKELAAIASSMSDAERQGYAIDLRKLFQILNRRRWIIALTRPPFWPRQRCI